MRFFIKYHCVTQIKIESGLTLAVRKIICLHVFVVAWVGWIPGLKIAITFLFIGIFDIRSLEKIQWIKLTLGISKLLSNSLWILLWKCGFLLNSCVVIFCITLASFLEWPLFRSDQMGNFESCQHEDVVQTHISSIGQINLWISGPFPLKRRVIF